jgi:hypothetical protein
MMFFSRRRFIKTLGTGGSLLLFSCSAQKDKSQNYKTDQTSFLKTWQNPPREFSQAPFWFWNDRLTEEEISRQMQDFCDHGIYGFVIHPRVGLPKDTGWMSEKMIHFIGFALEEAVKKNMWVVLYDEGMYPSGAASGQVVAQNSVYRPRGLFAIDLDEANPGDKVYGFAIGGDGIPILEKNQKLLAIVTRKKNGHRIAIVDRYIREGYALIRGLHFLEEDPLRREDKREVAEEMPPLADILNPEAMKTFIKLVYQRYFDEFSEYFGKTIKAIFTDEPSFFGKRVERGAIPGNAEVLDHVNKWLGYDFTPSLPALFFEDESQSEDLRKIYYRALEARLEETYYKPLSLWCQEHNVALTGHPADPDDIGQLRYFQIPGQDIVWRYIEPGKSNALEGAQSTMAKCASSAMIHLRRRRNSNEYCGAYGHEFSFREMKWLANWLLVRGCNLLYPHAFYYSIRGPRIDERPPDVGPNNVWWDQFKSFAHATSRLCWLNTDSHHVCEVAILGLNDYLPWQAAKVCFQNQIDFNYLEARHLWEDAQVSDEGIKIAGMFYKTVIIEMDPPSKAQKQINQLSRAGRVIFWNEKQGENTLLKALDKLVSRDIVISPPDKNIRIRHVLKNGYHCYLIFNEGEAEVKITTHINIPGNRFLLEIESGEIEKFSPSDALLFPAHRIAVLVVGDLA